MKYAAIVAVVSAACVIPYMASNVVSTGHPLPISGAVKGMRTDQLIERNGLTSRFAPEYARFVLTTYRAAIRTFVSGRVADGTTLLGGRLLLGDGQWTAGFFGFLLLLLVLPLAFGAKPWLSAIRAAFARLRPFWFVLPFALVNAAVSAMLYPHQIRNAIVKWWLVESELVLIVLSSTLVGTAVAYIGTRLVPPGLRLQLAGGGLILLVALHGQQMVRFYWDGTFQVRDWNASWNQESLRAAEWLSVNVPENAIVGSWNAGVLGYHAAQRVTNLDGLINNFELLPYLRERRIGAYIAKKNIEYLSDVEPIFTAHGIHDQLSLREVYSHRNWMTGENYKIYRIER